MAADGLESTRENRIVSYPVFAARDYIALRSFFRCAIRIRYGSLEKLREPVDVNIGPN